MKIRIGFISNSSSTSFVIHNNTNETQSIYHFATELVDVFNLTKSIYDFDDTLEEFLGSAGMRDDKLKPGKNIITFGDEDGDSIGRIFDYGLRNGGSSKSYTWKFHAYNR